MKNNTSIRFRTGLYFIVSFIALACMTILFSCKKTAEKATEKIIEKSMGDDANVDIDDQKIVMETEEGTFTSDATVRSWPKEIPNEIPEFKFGKISNLSTQVMDEGKGWTFIFEEVGKNAMDDYKKLLKDKGFKVSSISMPGGQGQVTGEMGKTIVAMMAGENMATLNVSIEK
ncbi:MAG: hypothetical protein HKO81_04750 [Flavobacteriaceae bacterium]|nr:hypothetical protein [Flavobacteriaceae bacterium]